jgi:hypothetical protein
MTTKRNRRTWAWAWAIGLSVFPVLLVIGVIANAFGTPAAATKADPARLASRVKRVRAALLSAQR